MCIRDSFIDEELNSLSNLTTGRVYSSVIQKERRGEYLGSTVPVSYTHLPGRKMPEGSRCRANFPYSFMTVWPAFPPP